MQLKIIEQDGSDLTFAVPWKGREVIVKYESPAGCIGPSFNFEIEDEEEYDAFEEYLWDRIDISTTVELQGE